MIGASADIYIICAYAFAGMALLVTTLITLEQWLRRRDDYRRLFEKDAPDA